VGRNDRKGILVRPKRRWENNIRMDFRKVRCCIDCVDLAQDRNKWRAVVDAVMKLPGSMKCGEFLD
jgi:hypothetical protein